MVTNLDRWRLSLVIINVTALLYSIMVQPLMQYYDRKVDYPRYPKPKGHYNDMQRNGIRNASFYADRERKEHGYLNKTLLIWTPKDWFVDWVGEKWDTSQMFSSCPVSNCVVTKQRQYMDKADAVLFRYRRLECHKKRKRGQVWIIFEHEPPTRLRGVKRCHHNLFNWTMTYRRDSDFTLVHGQFSKATSHYNESALNMIFKAKTKTAVAFISHCKNVQSRRIDYISKLRKYGIDVDIYGRCGTLQCITGSAHRTQVAWGLKTSGVEKERGCFDVLDSRYKFYLSFENSLCDDYVTEKSLHLVLRHNIVPIIRDASNHTLFHPPTSYLDTKDFDSVKSLGARIKQMNNDFDEYKKYLHWKKYFSSETIGGVLQSILCDMCNRLHNQHRYQRIYRDVGEFLFSRAVESPICHEPADL